MLCCGLRHATCQSIRTKLQMRKICARMGYSHHARSVQCHFGFLNLNLVVRYRLLAWCAHACDLCPVVLQMFPQQLDASRVWFIKNDGSTLAHREIDQPIQNRSVSSVSAEPNFARFLSIITPFNLSKDFIHKFLFASNQDVVFVSPSCRGFRVVHVLFSDLVPDCSNFLVREIVPHS